MHKSIPAAPSSLPPPPPGNCGAFARLVSPGGGALANLAEPGGGALANPGGTPRTFDIHVVSSKTWKISDVKISGLWGIDLSSNG